mgnify:CR=1 FL=1
MYDVVVLGVLKYCACGYAAMCDLTKFLHETILICFEFN